MNLMIDPARYVAHAQQARFERPSGEIALEPELSTRSVSVRIVLHCRAAQEIIAGLNSTGNP
jgi:hypothetical protein